MNNILTIILVVLIIAVFTAFAILITLVYHAAKKLAQLRKEKAELLRARKYLEKVVSETETLQNHVIDQAVRMSAEELIRELSKDE